MAFIGFVGFVVILFSAVKIIVAGKPTAGGEEKGPYARHFLRADLGAFFDKSRLLARTFSDMYPQYWTPGIGGITI